MIEDCDSDTGEDYTEFSGEDSEVADD